MSTLCPRMPLSLSARSLATKSVGPPAGNATTMRMGRLGKSCAVAVAADPNSATTQARTPRYRESRMPHPMQAAPSGGFKEVSARWRDRPRGAMRIAGPAPETRGADRQPDERPSRDCRAGSAGRLQLAEPWRRPAGGEPGDERAKVGLDQQNMAEDGSDDESDEEAGESNRK